VILKETGEAIHLRATPAAIPAKVSTRCRKASHLTPDRLPTLTPSMAAEVFVTTKENSHWLGFRLGANRGQRSEPVYILAFYFGAQSDLIVQLIILGNRFDI
jgi:hypothetical protein